MNQKKLFQDDSKDENFSSPSRWGTRTMAYMFLQYRKLSLIYHIAPADIASGPSFLRQFLLTA